MTDRGVFQQVSRTTGRLLAAVLWVGALAWSAALPAADEAPPRRAKTIKIEDKKAEPDKRANDKRAVPEEPPARQKQAAKKEASKDEAEKRAVDERAAARDARKAEEKKKVTNRILQRKLQTRTDLEYENLPLKEVMQKFAELHEITIRLDEAAFKKVGVAPDKRVSGAIRNFTLSLALKHVLKDLNLHYAVIDGEIVIGDPPPPEPEPEPRPVAAERGLFDQLVDDVVVEAAPAMIQFNGMGGPGNVQQFTRQYKSLLKAELHLVRAACQPTDEQWEKINARLDLELKTKLGQFQNDQKKAARQQRGGQFAVGDPLQLSRAWVLKAVKEHLTDEQAAQFKQEVDERVADRRRASVHNIVSRLDQDLYLSTTQREQISAKLTENWKDQWCPSLVQFMQMEQWLPNLPDPYVAEFLEPVQQEIWKSNRASRTNNVVFAPGAFVGFLGGMFGEEVLWGGEPPAGEDLDLPVIQQERAP
ncbi:MAG: DUF4974 domain-containing protein [Planctomycetia bacterium]|nr:DUF4974 domain-containing protein [Planctomycetia bacterium]